MIPMAFWRVSSQYGPITVLGQKYLAKNAGLCQGNYTRPWHYTRGLKSYWTLGRHLDDVQTALMTLIPVGTYGLLMSLWLKEPNQYLRNR